MSLLAEGRTLSTAQVKQIRDILLELKKEMGVIGVIVVDETGLPIASVGISESNELAISNTVMGSFIESEKLMRELGIISVDGIIIETKDYIGYVVGSKEGKAYLCLICDHDANLSVIRVRARKTINEIYNALKLTAVRAEIFFDSTEKLTWLTEEERKKWREIAGQISIILSKKDKEAKK